jgi:hypothetical protein
MDPKSGHGSVRLGTGSRYLIRDQDATCGEVFIRKAWAFATDQHRGVPRGKTYMPKG